MSASLRGRFCAHGIAGEDYCEDCHVIQQENCNHDWRRAGFNPNWGQIWECERCGGVTP